MKKRIIVCCDGTWNDLEMRYITNVGRLVQALLPEGKSGSQTISQLVFYDDGIGADAGGLQRLLQGGFGSGIDNLIYEAYRFVCVNYEPGDEICLFGFSRGAFTVRSVAGMLGKVGLVPRKNLKQVPEALASYRSKDDKRQKKFKDTYTYGDRVKIALLGCWDTVGALGIPDKIPFLPIDNIQRKRYQFHDMLLGSHIQHVLHAVAIDERRKEFEATLMKKADDNTTTKLIQTWFPGDHGCVGGGSWEKRGLSNNCLRWMIETADKKMGIHIGVDWERLHDRGISDHSISFSPKTKFIYSERDRVMPADVVSWDDIDQTARLRWIEHRDKSKKDRYEPPKLKQRFAAELNNYTDTNARVPPAEITHLNVGKVAHLRVIAETKNNCSNIQVNRGEKYEIEVSRLQVWKDKDFDPCDIYGWNTIAPAKVTGSGTKSKIPYEGGEKVNFSTVKTAIINKAGKKVRLVREADWFELVMSIGKDNFMPLGIKKPLNDETKPFTIKFTARHSGELIFAANDAASSLDIIDKYDNNAGWVWIKIKRIA